MDVDSCFPIIGNTALFGKMEKKKQKSRTITSLLRQAMITISNIHPGEILLKEFLKPISISQNKCARDINLSPRRINEICLVKRGKLPTRRAA